MRYLRVSVCDEQGVLLDVTHIEVANAVRSLRVVSDDDLEAVDLHIGASAPKVIKFRDLKIGDRFEFDHTGLPLCHGMPRGPWIKISTRKYKHVNPELTYWAN